MDLTKLEQRLESYGSGAYYLLEAFILQLLRLEAQENGQTLETDVKRPSSDIDAFAPKGLGTIPGPLWIEIAPILTPRTLQAIVNIFTLRKASESDKLLIITLRQMAAESETVKKILVKRVGNVVIWNADDLQRLMNKHQGAASELFERLFSVRLEMAVSKSSDDWKGKRGEIVAKVSENFATGRFSFLLGAGVSSSAGLPDWDTLLNSLFVSMLTDGDLAGKTIDSGQLGSIVKRLRAVDGPSALMLARYIRRGLSSGSKEEQSGFIQAVTKQLYSLRDQRRSLSSSLIKAIASLCTPTRTGAKVRSVLTYNFDDLIERELESRNLSFRSIFEDLETAAPEELPIFHVHGFLPEERSKYANLDRGTLVFSEEGYHQIYGDAYHWSNLVQLAALKETACVMVGLSLADPNLRRLLEIASKSVDKPKHFAFLRRVDLDHFMKENDNTVVKAPTSVAKRFLDRHHSLNEEVMRELGVNVIWYESYDEIPTILNRIGKSV